MAKSRLFLSYTVKDLSDYRRHVEERLRAHMTFDLRAMKGLFDPGVSGTPEGASLEQLDLCQAFLGIIGPIYGTMPANEERSIAHMEHDRAIALNKARRLEMEFLVARPGAIALPEHLREGREKEERHREWVRDLERVQQLSYFEDFEHFTIEFNKALERLEYRVGGRAYTSLFSREQAADVMRETDRLGNRRESRVDRILSDHADRFREIMPIGSGLLHDVPAFRDLAAALRAVVLDIDFNSERSEISRAGVRHALVRVQTLIPILGRLPQAELEAAGNQIGLSAAQDFCRYFLDQRSHRVPDSLGALLEVLNQWDHTGGWGRIALVEGPAKMKALIRVSHHFLVIDDDLELTHQLCSFWAGYLRGFLTHSLIHYERMLDLRNEPDIEGTSLPLGLVPFSVTHILDSTLEEDLFTVVFRRRPDFALRKEIGIATRRCESDPAAARQAYKVAMQQLLADGVQMTLPDEIPSSDGDDDDDVQVRVHMNALLEQCDFQLEQRAHVGSLTRAPSIRSLNDLTHFRRPFGRPLVLFSGGLDGAFLLHKLKEAGVGSVVALTVNLGSSIDLALASDTCEALGMESVHVDYTEEFVARFVAPSIRAHAMYLGIFPVHATLSRPALAECAVREAKRLKCDAIIHTSTASQNSLRRFNGALAFHLSDQPFGSPFDVECISREEKRKALLAQGLEQYRNRSFSSDSTIYGVAYEAEVLDDPRVFNFCDHPELFPSPTAAQGASQKLAVEFERGLPVALDGERLSLPDILRRLRDLGTTYGLGWYSGLEENSSGRKVHEVRLMPAAEVLLKSYRFLEAAILPFEEIRKKTQLEYIWLKEATEGRWFDVTRKEAERVIAAASERVTGEVDVELRRHVVRPIAVRAMTPLYDVQRKD